RKSIEQGRNVARGHRFKVVLRARRCCWLEPQRVSRGAGCLRNLCSVRGHGLMFVADTDRKLGPCEHWDGKTFAVERGIYWSNVFDQTNRHPVVYVSWDDSQAYVKSLSRKTGKH